MSIHNPNCDGDRCKSENGQVRVLPHGDSNMVLCFDCWQHEINFRAKRNRELGKGAQFELPRWKTLQIYGEHKP